MKRFFAFVVQALMLAYLALQDSDRITIAAPADHIELFQTSDRCMACHNGLSTSSGEEDRKSVV